MAAGIASGFVRKLYRILDQESDTVVGWDASGLSFSIHDSQKLNDTVLPRYFRGRMSAFRQQLLDHGFEQLECEDNEVRECYRHPHFLRGFPDRLSYIVRVPKPKLKPGQSQSNQLQQQVRQPPPQLQQQHQQPQQFNPQTNTVSMYQQQSLGVHIAPSNRGPGRTPLTVTLSAGKRPSPSHATAQSDFASKRLRSTTTTTTMTHQRPTGPVQAPAPPANLSRNPLFSNDASTDLGLDVARVFSMSRISDSGLLPNSTDLPEPISYLNKLLHDNVSSGVSALGVPSSASSSSVSSSATPPIDTPVFSEDLMKSALYFLVSTSTTGVGPDQSLASSGNGAASSNSSSTWAAHVEKLSTSGFLSSLLVSSATGKDTGGGAPSLSLASVWGPPSANPLFSKSSEQDEEEEDSIWNLLLASSIDRVKSAIQDAVSPQERLRLILEERERLEEQRKRIYGVNGQDSNGQGTGTDSRAAATAATSGPYKPTTDQSAKPLKSALKKPTTATSNPLFDETKEETISHSVLFEKTSASPRVPPKAAIPKTVNPLFANDDDEDDDSSSAGNPLFSKAINPLFSSDATGSETSTTPAAPSIRPVIAGASGAEDGLWRLLMTSSVDWLRKGAAEFEI